MADSPYRMSIAEFQRRTPRVHARPVDPDDPDGEMEPATAFAAVEQPDPPPNPNLIEGMIAGLGRIGSARRTPTRPRHELRADDQPREPSSEAVQH
ncbi:MAG: hypothetical protein ACRDTP_01060 [Mycobacteriales bacterium]